MVGGCMIGFPMAELGTSYVKPSCSINPRWMTFGCKDVAC
jgi:hypothetical protein